MADDRSVEERIAADLRARIMAGRLPPGTRLESIPATAARLGVSQASVQHAWERLKTEGFLTSHRGKGVFARRDGIRAEDVATHHAPGLVYTLLDVTEIKAPLDVAEALGEERVIVRFRRADRHGAPVELVWAYYPVSIAAGTLLAERTLINGGAPRLLAELGYAPQRFTGRLLGRPPTTEEAKTLGIPRGVPVLRQLRVAYADGGRPVEVCESVWPAHRCEVRYSGEFREEGYPPEAWA